MSKQFKWICGLCTYENYPASLKCVMCYQPLPTPLIHESMSDGVICEAGSSDRSHVDKIEQNMQEYGALNNSSDADDHSCEDISDDLKDKMKLGDSDENKLNGSAEQIMIAGASAATNIQHKKETDAFTESYNKNNEINKKWPCPTCTYVNWNRSKKCVICLTSKSHSNMKNRGGSGADTISTQRENDIRISSLSHSNTSESLDNCEERQSGAYGSRSLSPTDISSRLACLHRGSETVAQRKCSEHDSLKNWLNSQDAPSSSGFNSSQQVSGKSSKRSEQYAKASIDHGRLWKKSCKELNWLFLKACIGVLEDNFEAVDRYLSCGGNIARALTPDEVRLLNRSSAFDAGHTLVHLAVRFQRHNILALILTPEITKRNLKRNPSVLCPEIADLICHEILNSIWIRKGDFHCQYFCDYVTFYLPLEISCLPSSIQHLLFDELLDKDVQKELEDEGTINWYTEADRLYALWNRSAGDCLLDSVLQATWGIFDKDNVLRRTMAETMQECSSFFYQRWRESELMQAGLLDFSLSERQCHQDWQFIQSLAQQPGASLEHCHIFVLSHILRRPIIVYGVKYLKSFQGGTLGFARFQGVYLPFLWDRDFCYKSPITLGYTPGHFTALVAMEKDFTVTPQNSSSESSSSYTYLPLMDYDRKLLPIHFTSHDQGTSEEQQECLLYEWLDCLMTSGGLLMAKQNAGKRPPLVTRLLDQWLDHYRHLSFRRLDEDGDTEDEE